MCYRFFNGGCLFSGHPVQKVVVVFESNYLVVVQISLCADVLQSAEPLRWKIYIFLAHVKSICITLSNTKITALCNTKITNLTVIAVLHAKSESEKETHTDRQRD